MARSSGGSGGVANGCAAGDVVVPAWRCQRILMQRGPLQETKPVRRSLQAIVLIGLLAMLLGCAAPQTAGTPEPASAAVVLPSDPMTEQLNSPSSSPSFQPFSDPGYSGYEVIAVGLGGSLCELDTISDVFGPSDSVRLNAEYSPSLRAGTSVMIHLTREGQEVRDYPVAVQFEVSTDCVYGDLWPDGLPLGRYRLDVVPDTAPAVFVDFEVIEPQTSQ
jgi:hypothetical protein